MKRLAIMCFALLLFHVSPLAAQTPPPQTEAPKAAPLGVNLSNPNGTADPRVIATAPPGTPVVHERIPVLPDVSDDYEDWHVEATASYWAIQPTGKVETLSTPGDLKDDLGIQGYKSIPYIKLSGRLNRRNQITLEALPFQLSGAAQLNRELEFLGRTFLIQDQITSLVKLDAFALNYQHNFVANKNGFVGLIAGIGYVAAHAKIISITRNVEEDDRANAAFPQLGAAFRAYPGRSNFFNVNGEIKGMDFGNLGYLLQTTLQTGFAINHKTTLEVGYSVFDADVHNKGASQGLKVNFSGPMVSIQFRDK